MADAEEKKEFWEDKHFAFMQNRKCEYFPCHKTGDLDNFNCLFCYCPLYALGDKCGGNFKLNEGGIKDCSDCLIPHRRKGYGYIVSKYPEIVALVKKQIREAGKGEEQKTDNKELLIGYEK